jgi:hypothetical protein
MVCTSNLGKIEYSINLKIGIMKNWKTTLAGVLGAIAQVIVLPVNSWKDLIVPVVTALIGILSKDAGTTGSGM